MDCRTSSEIMMKWMDGPLAELEEQQWMNHVAQCEACRQEYKEWKEIKHALAHLPQIAPGEGFEHRVMAAIDPDLYKAVQPASRQHRWGHILVWTGALGLAGILVTETANLMRQMVQTWLQGNATYQALHMVYERFVVSGLLNFLMPQKGLLEWLGRFEGVTEWWTFLGTLNLIMLLVLIKLSLDRLLAGGRREVH